MLTAEPVGNRISLWGEGPVWYQSELTYVDINGKAIVCYDPATGDEREYHLDQNIGFAVPAQSGKWIYGGNHGIFSLDMKSGESTALHDPEPELTESRFNDGKTAPDGRLFAGTMCPKTDPGKAKLYQIANNGTCTTAYEPVTTSNGLAWAADSKTLYYIDTPSKEIKAFEYNSTTGALSNPRQIIDTSDDPSSPDGMCIDTDNNLWVAFCHGGCVKQFDPAAGKLIQKIDIPALETTSCTFGGGSGSDLYVTTGIHKTEQEQWGGSLFVIRDTGTHAPPAVPFADSI
ncbi:MAG: SMP-30/gluconolactonase/LRE family protein [Verrucomicrobiota bacterium]